MFLSRPGILTGWAASVTWLEDGGTSTDPSPRSSPALGGPVCPAETEASPFRQFPAPATEERRVEERLASLMVIRPEVWTRCQTVSSMFDAPIPYAIELYNGITVQCSVFITSSIISCQEIVQAVLFIHEIVHIL